MSFVTVEEAIAAKPALAKLTSGALQDLLDANEVLVRKRIGGELDSTDSVTVTVPGYPASVLLLPERVASITSITEHWALADVLSDIELDAADWRLYRQGTAIERLLEGPNPSEPFADYVIIEYVPFDENALRKNVIIQLCNADVNFTPGISSQRLGDYAETKSSSATGQVSIAGIKEDILSQLDPVYPVFA
jgi:hypothetical protein